MAYGRINLNSTGPKERCWSRRPYITFQPEFYVSGSKFCVRVTNPSFSLDEYVADAEKYEDYNVMNIFGDFQWTAVHQSSSETVTFYIDEDVYEDIFRLVIEYGTETIVLRDGAYDKNAATISFTNQNLTASTFKALSIAEYKYGFGTFVVSDNYDMYPDDEYRDEGIAGLQYYQKVYEGLLDDVPLHLISKFTKYNNPSTMFGGDASPVTNALEHNLGVIPKMVIIASYDMVEKPTTPNMLVSAVLFNPRHQSTCMGIVEYTKSDGTLAYETRTWNVTKTSVTAQQNSSTYKYIKHNSYHMVFIA